MTSRGASTSGMARLVFQVHVPSDLSLVLLEDAFMQELGLVVLAGNALCRNRVQACIHGQLYRLSAQRQVQVDTNLKLAAPRHLPVEF